MSETKEGEALIRKLEEVSNEKPESYQIILLKNDLSNGVEVHESEEVNFVRISEHLANGGSVFITSKTSQKPLLPVKKQAAWRRKPRKTVRALYFDHM